jgi:hypothetical protein
MARVSLTRSLSSPAGQVRVRSSDRHRKGKDDDLDAINAAQAALRGQRTSIPKSKGR